ncbi:MAG: MATE family efflux transporter [Acidimicrobiia bacterium]|nr:MATE family efflux transporter [Acidimicrobiia bacterium]
MALRLRSAHDGAIARLAVPAFGTLLAEPLYVVADTAIVGHLGTAELAGLALASTLLLAVHGICIFLAYGTTSAVSRLLGAGDARRAVGVAVQSLWLAAVIGAVVGAGLAAGATPLLGGLGGRGDALEAGRAYLRLACLGLPFLLMSLAGGGTFHGRQNARVPLVLAVAGNVANLGLELALVPGLGYGIGASALATSVVQAGVGIVYTRLVVGWASSPASPTPDLFTHSSAGDGPDEQVAGTTRGPGVGLRPVPAEMRALLRAGRPLVLRTLSLRAAFTLATAAAARVGVQAVAAHQVAIQVWSTLGLALDAVAIAGQSLTGRWLGAGAAEQARAAARRMVELDVALGVVAGALTLVFRRPIAGLFTDDPVLIGLIAYLLVWVALAEPLNGFVFALDGILIGAGDLAYLGRAMTAVSVAFLAMGAAVIATDAGLGWLWTALTAFMFLRGVAVWWRWRSGRWLVTGAL